MVFVNWGYGQVGSRHGDKMPEIIHVEVERFVWAHRLRGFSRRLLGLMLWHEGLCGGGSVYGIREGDGGCGLCSLGPHRPL